MTPELSGGTDAASEGGAELSGHLDQLRDIEGFPLGEDAAILDLSLPPHYAACPNPSLFDGVDPGEEAPDYQCPPFAGDISEGRSDPVYKGQVYHTKVPPRAIARYIEHYCPEGGLVFDGFCGAGMTGVAARLTGRRAMLVDLSPAATAIAAAYCLPADAIEARSAARALIETLQEECGWLYEVPRAFSLLPVSTDYVIWSEVYRCPRCGAEAPFSDTGFDFSTRRPLKISTCQSCGQETHPDHLERCTDSSGLTREVPVRVKVLDRKGGEQDPTEEDLELLRQVAEAPIPFPYPDDWMMGREPGEKGWGDMWRGGYHTGVVRASDFYFKRSVWVIAAALHYLGRMSCSPSVRHLLRVSLVNASLNLTRMHRAYQGPVPLVLYLPRLRRERNAILALQSRLATTLEALESLPRRSQVRISTQSGTSLPQVPDACVDYIFTDPPFGQNIIYSEVNFLWETWLGVRTNQQPEAIVSKRQRKGIAQYQDLMERCFAEAHRILKPGRWITVEFHNSQNSVWNAIQEALQRAGFVVADVRMLDKQQQSFKQASTANAVKNDLVISAYKPRAGDPADAQRTHEMRDPWEFVAEHLAQLPLLDEEADGPAVLVEREDYRLYDRLVAYYVVRGLPVPLGAAEFYRELRLRFSERSGMFYLPEQAADCDRNQARALREAEAPLVDEKSAIVWLRSLLRGGPRELADIATYYERRLQARRGEVVPPLPQLLAESFACDEQGRWALPDAQGAQELETRRREALLREFEALVAPGHKTPSAVRSEAVRAGMRALWQAGKYREIVAAAEHLPEALLREDPELLMYTDNAMHRCWAER